MTNQQQLNDFAGVFDLKIVFTLITVVYLYILIFTDRRHHTKTKTVAEKCQGPLRSFPRCSLVFPQEFSGFFQWSMWIHCTQSPKLALVVLVGPSCTQCESRSQRFFQNQEILVVCGLCMCDILRTSLVFFSFCVYIKKKCTTKKLKIPRYTKRK